MEGNEEWEKKEDWRAIMRGISDAKDGSMHVYGFLCAGDWRAQIYTHTYTHIHTRGRAHIRTHIHRRNDRYLAGSNFGYTHLVLSVRKHS